MAVTDLFCGGILLSAIGVIGFSFARPKKATEEFPASSDAPAKTPTDDQIEALRALHQVSLIGKDDEGFGAGRVPDGVYGFSYAPHQESPIFRGKGFQSFEVHKLPDASVHLIGFVTEREAAQVSAGDDYVDLDLYPDPWKDSMEVVSIPLSRVLRFKSPSRQEGNGLKIHLAPASDTGN